MSLFLSYSSEDLALVHQIVNYLESQGISVWYADRDLEQGMTYSRLIPDAIGRCDALLLLYSEAADGSAHVDRELDIACRRGKRLYWIRTDDTMPENLEYYLYTVQAFQWLRHDSELLEPLVTSLRGTFGISTSKGEAPDSHDESPDESVTSSGEPIDDAVVTEHNDVTETSSHVKSKELDSLLAAHERVKRELDEWLRIQDARITQAIETCRENPDTIPEVMRMFDDGVSAIEACPADHVDFLWKYAQFIFNHDESERRGVEVLELALRQAATRENPEERRPFSILGLLSSFYLGVGESEKAEQAINESIAMLRGMLEEPKWQPHASYVRDSIATFLSGLGGLLQDSERSAEAEDAYREALAIRESLAADNSEQYGAALCESLLELGRFLLTTERFDEAEAVLRNAIDSVKPDWGSAAQKPRLRAMNELGVVLEKLGRTQEAADCYSNAMTYGIDVFETGGEGIESTLVRTANLAQGVVETFVKTKEYVAARRIAVELVQVRERLDSGDDASTFRLLAALSTLANIDEKLESYEAAEATHQRILELGRKVSSVGTSEVSAAYAQSMKKYAQMLARIGRYADAERWYQEAIGVFRDNASKNPDSGRDELAEVLSSYACMVGEIDLFDQARDAIEEAVSIRRNLATTDDKKSQEALMWELNLLGSVYSSRQEWEDAKKANEEALAISTRIMNMASESEAFKHSILLTNLAYVESGLEDYEAAQMHMREVVSMREPLSAKDFAQYGEPLANAMQSLGFNLHRLGNLEEAEHYLFRSLEMRQQLSVMPDQEEAIDRTPDVFKDCGKVRAAQNRYEEADSLFAEGLTLLRTLFDTQPEVYRFELVEYVADYADFLSETPFAERSTALYSEALELAGSLPFDVQRLLTERLDGIRSMLGVPQPRSSIDFPSLSHGNETSDADRDSLRKAKEQEAREDDSQGIDPENFINPAWFTTYLDPEKRQQERRPTPHVSARVALDDVPVVNAAAESKELLDVNVVRKNQGIHHEHLVVLLSKWVPIAQLDAESEAYEALLPYAGTHIKLEVTRDADGFLGILHP